MIALASGSETDRQRLRNGPHWRQKGRDVLQRRRVRHHRGCLTIHAGAVSSVRPTLDHIEDVDLVMAMAARALGVRLEGPRAGEPRAALRTRASTDRVDQEPSGESLIDAQFARWGDSGWPGRILCCSFAVRSIRRRRSWSGSRRIVARISSMAPISHRIAPFSRPAVHRQGARRERGSRRGIPALYPICDDTNSINSVAYSGGAGN